MNSNDIQPPASATDDFGFSNVHPMQAFAIATVSGGFFYYNFLRNKSQGKLNTDCAIEDDDTETEKQREQKVCHTSSPAPCTMTLTSGTGSFSTGDLPLHRRLPPAPSQLQTLPPQIPFRYAFAFYCSVPVFWNKPPNPVTRC